MPPLDFSPIPEPRSRVRFAAFWIFTPIFSALIVLAVVAAGMRALG